MKIAPTDTTQNETEKGSSSDSGQGNGGETNKVPFIRSKDSIVDPSNKRLRILKASVACKHVVRGNKDTIGAQVFGESVANACVRALSPGKSRIVLSLLAMIGTGVLIADICTPSFPTWASFMCSLVLPWGILTLLSLKTSVLSRLLVTTFNLYLSQLTTNALLKPRRINANLLARRRRKKIWEHC